MKVLLVTGKLAEPLIHRVLEKITVTHEIEVLVLPLAVAAFLHPKFVSSQIRLRGPLDKYDLIILPGMISGDTTIVTESTGIPTFKGTRHVADLPILLENLLEATSILSTTQPADLVFSEQLLKKAEHDLAKAERRPKGKLPSGSLEIGKDNNSIFVGSRWPMRIIAEITDTPLKTDEEIIRTATYFVNSGAQIIDIGMIAESPNPDAAKSIVKKIRKHVYVPLSIDSLNVEEIIAGIEGGAQLVLSLDQDNMNDIPKRHRKRVTFTVIPATKDSGELPKTIDTRIQMLEDNLVKAKDLGFEQLIADPLCDPLITPGLTNALLSYSQFRKKQPQVPMMMGIGNITELLDADSPGVNALLAGIATELGVSILLTTEVSPKTKGSVWELFRATQMMYLARRRQSPPKDLGIDLLLLKSKRFPELPFEPIEEADYPVYDVTKQAISHRLDKTGYFTFHVDRQHHVLVARHYNPGRNGIPTIELRGSSAQQLIDEIIGRELVSKLDHAAYIGRELAKAELALLTGRPYIQEAQLFKRQMP